MIDIQPLIKAPLFPYPWKKTVVWLTELDHALTLTQSLVCHNLVNDLIVSRVPYPNGELGWSFEIVHFRWLVDEVTLDVSVDCKGTVVIEERQWGSVRKIKSDITSLVEWFNRD